MKFFVYSKTNKSSVSSDLGKPEYSYFFVLKEFLPLLSRLGEVEVVEDFSDFSQMAVEQPNGIFLAFSAPHNLLSFKGDPSRLIPVFAWEFDTLPVDSWYGEGLQDWRVALNHFGRAITHSQYTVQSVKDILGEDYPVITMPCPVWDRFEGIRSHLSKSGPWKKFSLLFDGVLIDSRQINLFVDIPTREEVAAADNERKMEMERVVAESKLAAEQAAELENKEKIREELARQEKAREELARQEEEQISVRLATDITAVRFKLSVTERLLKEFYFYVLSCYIPEFIKKPARALFSLGNRKNSEIPDEENSQELKVGTSIIAATDAEAVKLDAAATDTETTKLEAILEEPSEAKAFENAVFLEGVVYTTVFNPYDGRKNWPDMITAFCWAFRNEPNATLLLKISASHIVEFSDELVEYLKRLAPFQCRIVVVKAYLDESEYNKLMEGTSYYVNTSFGEGQCLPLMEYMSCGIPAVAPATTALADYICDDVAFVVKAHAEPASWQHDPRRAIRTLQYRVDWLHLVEMYQKSFKVAVEKPGQYSSMRSSAIVKLKNHCSLDVLEERLQGFLPEFSATRHL